MERCPRCNEELNYENSKFCTMCGFKIDNVQENATIQRDNDINQGSVVDTPQQPVFEKIIEFECPVCKSFYSLDRPITQCKECELVFLYDKDRNVADNLNIYYMNYGTIKMDNLIKAYQLRKSVITYDTLKKDMRGTNEQKFVQYRKSLLESGKKKLGVGTGLLLPILTTIVISILVFLSLFIVGLDSTGGLLSAALILTALYFVAVILYIKRFVGFKITMKERLILAGIPIGFYEKKDWIKDIVLGFAIGGFMLVAVALSDILADFIFRLIYGGPLSDYSNLVSDSIGLQIDLDITVGVVIAFAAANFIIIGPAEEAMFRAYSQTGFENSLGKYGGIIFGAFYFAMFHILVQIIMNPLIFIPTFLPYITLSLILSITYSKKGNIIACSIAHAFYNSMVLIIPFIIMTSAA